MKWVYNSSWVLCGITLTATLLCVLKATAQTIPGSSRRPNLTLNLIPEVGVFTTEALSSDANNLVVTNESFKNDICAGLFGSDPDTGKPIGNIYTELLPAKSSRQFNFQFDLRQKLELNLTQPARVNVFSFPPRFGPVFNTGNLPGTVPPATASCDNPSNFSVEDLKLLGDTGRQILGGRYLNVYEQFTPSGPTAGPTGKNSVPRTKVSPYDMNGWGSPYKGGGEIALLTFLLLATGNELKRRRQR